MTEPNEGEADFPDSGNLWDADTNSEGVRYLSTVSSQFALYVQEHLRWLHGDPLAGRDAKTQLGLGQALELVGLAVRHQAERRIRLADEYRLPVLSHLAVLPQNDRADADTIAERLDTDAESIVLVLDDLVRSEAVLVWRPRVKSRRDPVLYAISPQGRVLLERSPLVRPAV